jgi:hypothetical protein
MKLLKILYHSLLFLRAIFLIFILKKKIILIDIDFTLANHNYFKGIKKLDLNNATINNSIIKTVNFYIKKKYKPIIFTARGLGSFNSISKFLKKNSIVFFSPVLLLGNTKFKFYLLKILILLKKKIILIDDLSDLNFESLEFVTYNIKDFNICESKNFKYINPKSL